MVTIHLDMFNDAINAHGRTFEEFADHDRILWHEGKMYNLAKKYILGIDAMTSEEVDDALRNIRWHVENILEILKSDIDADCVMYEMIDVQTARYARMAG